MKGICSRLEGMWWPLNNVIRDEKLKAALNKQYLNQTADQVITKDQLANLQGTVTLDNKEIKDFDFWEEGNYRFSRK